MHPSPPVFIFDALRTPRGKARAGGGLAALSPQELVRQLVQGLNQRCAGAASRAEGLTLGCVGQVGAQGGHIALVSKLHAELPDACHAISLNNYCVSGLSAIGQAAAQLAAGQARALLAGGVEMMSQVSFMADQASYYSDARFPPRTRYMQVALAADRLASREGISRQALDDAALVSQQRAAAAQHSPSMQRSRVNMINPDGQLALDHDECVRPQTSAAALAAMEPAFAGLAAAHAEVLQGESFAAVHTVSHAPPICDGAGLALLGTDAWQSQTGIQPRARVVAHAEAGGDPAASLLAGLAAMNKALASSGLTLADMDRIEFMESFGVTLVKFLRDHPVKPEIVNVGGGHIAKGHPLGASGAVLLSSLLDVLDAARGRFGLVVCSGASGTGAAMIVERCAH